MTVKGNTLASYLCSVFEGVQSKSLLEKQWDRVAVTRVAHVLQTS